MTNQFFQNPMPLHKSYWLAAAMRWRRGLWLTVHAVAVGILERKTGIFGAAQGCFVRHLDALRVQVAAHVIAPRFGIRTEAAVLIWKISAE